MNLEALSSLVTRATAPGRFYRRLYGMKEGDAPLSINSWEEWKTLPLLTKSDLLNEPLSERSFLPIRDVDYLTSTSGTTGTLPLFSPRTQLLEYEFRTEFYDAAGPVFSSKLVPHQQEQFLSARNLWPRVVVIDPRNPESSVRLARAAGVDAIFAFLSHIPLVAGHMVRESIAENIRFIEVAGETCSRAQFEYMHRTFPNAVIISTYGLSEVENSPVGIPCRPMTAGNPLPVYHAKDGVYLELLDTKTGTVLEPEAGVEGELVITAYRGEPAAFPTLRYKSGDTVRVVDEHCTAHGSWSFTVLGRSDIDFVKIPGGMLKVDEIGRTLRALNDVVTDNFVLHLRNAADGARTRAILHVEPHAAVDLAVLAGRIAIELRVSPTSSYADGVAQGLYEPLICQLLDKARGDIYKQKSIILEP